MSGTFGRQFFDVQYYLTQNADVFSAIVTGAFQGDAWTHFQQYGRFENRVPNENFNPTQYLIANPDVLAAVNARVIASAWDHFVNWGVTEFRASGTFSGTFNDAAYLAANPDVNAAVGPGRDFASGYQHYLLYGQAEGRAAYNTAGEQINPDARIYTLTASADAVNEGDTVVFTLDTINRTPGDRFDYVISGVSAADVVGGLLTGTAVIDANGQAQIRVQLALDNFNELTETLTLTVAGQAQSVAINNVAQTILLTQGLDDVQGGESNDLIIGSRASSHLLTGEVSTYNAGDVVNGGGGSNTLRLFMDQGAIADGVAVSNIQQLDLRLNASNGGGASEISMTDWDASLQQINIRSNKSNLVVSEQKTIAAVSIVDGSTAAQNSSYTLGYTAGLLDGTADHLSLSVDNVNGEDGSDVVIDGGMEEISINVADRAGTIANANLYASNIDLNASGVGDVAVTGGRAGQTFTLDADVAGSADFDSTEFAGNMDLTSADIKTARFGAGSDRATISGWADNTDASYQLNAGNNEITFTGGLAGIVTAADGNDKVTAAATGGQSSINVGGGNNEVNVTGTHAGSVVAGDGNDNVTADSTGGQSSIEVGGGNNEVNVTNTHAGSVVAGDGNNEISLETVAATGSVTLGDGDNHVDVAEDVVGAITAGIGNNEINIEGSIGQTLFGNAPNTSSLSYDKTSLNDAVTTPFTDLLAEPPNSSSAPYVLPGHRVKDATFVPNFAPNIEIPVSDSFSIYGDDEVDNGQFEVYHGTYDALTGIFSVTMTPGMRSDNGPYPPLRENAPTHTLVLYDNDTSGSVKFIEGIVFEGFFEERGFRVTGPQGARVFSFSEDYGLYVPFSGGSDSGGSDRIDVERLTLGDGNNVVNVGYDIQNGSAVSFGEGENTLTVGGSIVRSTVSFGDGNNTVSIGDDVEWASSLSFGEGENALTVGGSIVSSTVSFGDGNNTVSVGGDVADGASLQLGNGGNTVTIEGETVYASISFGDGDDTLTAEDGIYTSTVNMGGGADTLNLLNGFDAGDFGVGWEQQDDAAKTMIDMGSGNDLVNILSNGGNLGEDYGYIYSGGFVDGSSGNDTLVFSASDSARLIGRDINQLVTVDYSEELFTLGQVITVTFERGDDTFEVEYTVVESDFIQGPEGLAAKVAESVAAQLNDDDAFDALFTASAVNGVLTIESDAPLEDFVLTSSVGEVEVVQLSDAEITSFETIDLVALNSAGEDNITINADFELIEGTTDINLISQVERIETDQDEELNGAYTQYTQDGPTTFELVALKGGEAITVGGHETSATGNSQVSRIVVDIDDDDHVVGDTISVTINDVTVDYVVTAADLNADTGLLDANQIANSLAIAITSAAAAAGLTVSVDPGVDGGSPTAPQITLIGQPGVAFNLEVAHTRFEATEIDIANLTVEGTSFNITGAMGNLRAGDVITITVGDVEATYTVTEEDCARLESDAIVAHFKAELGLGGDWGVLTSVDPATLTVTRVIDLVEEERDGDQTFVEDVQDATDTDDGIADVVINATLAADATNTTMDLTVAGEGDFDIAITGGEDSGFTDLELTLADSHDHTINTGGLGFDDDAPIGNFADTIIVSDASGVNTTGSNIVLEDVLAHTVTSTSKANLTIDQYATRDVAQPEDEVITVTTGTGDDHLITLAQSALTQGSSINLGEGRNTLSLGWGNGVVLNDGILDNALRDQLDPWGYVRTKDKFFETPEITVGTQVQAEMHPASITTNGLQSWGDEDSFRVLLTAGKTYQFSLGGVGSTPPPRAIELFAWSKAFIDGNQGSDELSPPWFAFLPATFATASVYKPGNDTSNGPKSNGLNQHIFTQNDIYESDSLIALQITPVADTWVNFYVYDDRAPFGRYAAEVFENNGAIQTSLQYNTPTQVFEVFDEVEEGAALDFSSMNFSGNLAELELQNDIVAFYQDQHLVMPGAAANVEALKLTNYTSVGANDLTVTGAANDFHIESNGDFELGTPGQPAVGRLTVNNAAGQQITGDLLVQSEGNININIGNARLASITAIADDYIDVEYSDNVGGTFVVGDILIESTSSSDSEAELKIEDNSGTSVTIGDVTAISDDDSDLEIEDNTNLVVTLGDVVLLADEDADVFIENNTGSSITMGSVSVTQEDAEDDSWVQFSENAGTTVVMGPLTIDVAGGGYDAELLIGETDDDDDGNIDSSFTVNGPIALSAQDDVSLDVKGNVATNVSLAVDSVITLTACRSTGFIDVELNRNENNHDPLGPDPLSDEFIQNYAVILGDLVMDAGDFIDLDIIGNEDNTYFGEMSVTVGDVQMFTHNYAELSVRDNDSVTVTIGDMDLRAKTWVELIIDNNDGRIYDNTLANPAREEPDYAVVTIGDITSVSDDFTYFGIGDNDLAQITVGDVSLTAGDQAGIEIVSNTDNGIGKDQDAAQTEITLGDVTIDAQGLAGLSIGLHYSGYGAGDDFFGETGELQGGNVNAIIDLGAVSLTGSGENAATDLVIANNRGEDGRGTVDIDSVDMTSEGDAQFFVYNNTLTGVYGEDEAALTVGDVVMSADEDANFAITDNGSLGLVVAPAYIGLPYLPGSTTMAFGDITLTAGEDDNAQVDIDGNGFVVIETGDVILSGNNTGLFVNDNGFSSVLLGDVELTSTEGGDYVADVTVNGNFASNIEMGTVTIDSDEDALIEVDSNSAYNLFIQSIFPAYTTTVTMGSVDVDADSGAQFFVTNNSDTTVTIGMDGEDADGRGTITIDAAYIGGYGRDAEGFAVLAGEDTDVVLGHVSLSAAGDGTDSDVDVAIAVEGEDSSIDMGDLTVNADGDAYVTLYGGEDNDLTVGDIVIDAGLDQDLLSSELYFRASDLNGNAANSGEDGTQTITLSASSGGEGDGFIHAVVDDARDLSALTISGTDAEVYLTGFIGTSTEDTTVFSLDLSGLTGAFDDGAVNFTPLYQGEDDQVGQDDGTYVETWNASFGGDVVRVTIGQGDMIYNARHSSWGEDDENDWGSPWDADLNGWYSLGGGGDFEPRAQTQVITGFIQASENVGDDTTRTYYNAIQFEQDGQSYRAQVSLTRSDDDDFIDVDNEDYVSFDNTPDYFKLVGGTWQSISSGDLEAELGIDSIAYSGGAGGYADNRDYGGTWTLTGGPDGTPFANVTDVQQVKVGSTNPTIFVDIDSTPADLLASNSLGDLAEDNHGQLAKEIFTFTGDEVGEIVIGGFNPGQWGQVNPENGRLTDQLDFSQFDWSGDGEANDAGLVNLNYFRVAVEDGDGYFKDVVIDFIGGEGVSAGSVEFGSIRLVGVGEFDSATQLVQDSIMFA